VFEDVPWARVRPDAPPHLAACAETFFCIQTSLPDFVARGLAAVRSWTGPTWFLTSWAYEKSRHQLALAEWLERSGSRTRAQLAELELGVLARPFRLPFTSARQLVFYGAVQEMATFVTYAKHRDVARRADDECLKTIYDFVARDAIAHARFFEGATRLLLEFDRPGTLVDMASVLESFFDPASVLPDYEERMRLVREAGLDRGVFIQRVYVPLLKHLGVSRRELALARKQAERNKVRPAEPGVRSAPALLTVA